MNQGRIHLLARVALTCRVKTWVKLSEFLLAGRHSYVGCALVCSACLAVVGMSCGLSNAADRTKKPMRESATLPADNNAQKRFGLIEDYLAVKRWSEAIDLLQEISQTDGRLLVQAKPETSSTPATSLNYVNVATRCNVLLSQLPAEGLVIYRKKVDPQAKRWLDHWKQTRDEGDLQRVVREAYLSSMGDDALWELGELAWDRGDLASARLYWTQLVPLGQEARDANLPTVLRYPDTDLDQAAILARLILCTLLEGDRDRAAIEIEHFQGRYPDATGMLANRQGRLVDLLKQIHEESSRWNLTNEEVATFGLNNKRSGTVPESVDIGASKWSRPLPRNGGHATDRGPLSYHPVTYENFVFVNNARSIWAWNLLTGEPAWVSDRGTAEIYPPIPDDVSGLPHQKPSIGVPHYTMTIAEGRLYARMGSPITNVAEGDSAAESELVCLDVATGQGKLVWKVASHELVKEEHTWRFEGSPLVVSGRAYVVLSRRPQFEFAIACLEASSGALMWHRPVAFVRGNVEDHQNRISHLLLTAGAGKLFLSTDAGAIVAVNQKDGRLDWAVTYESIAPVKPSFQSSAQYGLIPAMFHEGLLFVAPSDGNRLFCIEADSGRVRWQLKQPEQARDRWRHLLGVVPGGDAGRLIVSGTSLTSIDIATKKIVFGPRGSGPGNRQSIPEVDRGYGRGVIAGKVIIWPTLESIKVVDSATGIVIGNKPLHAAGVAETGGNLSVAQGMVLVAQPDRLVVYCEYSLLKRRLEKQISEIGSPRDSTNLQLTSAGDDPNRSAAYLYGQLSDLEFAQGNLAAAILALRQAIGSPDEMPVDASTARLRSRLIDLLRQSSRTSISEGHATVAVEQLTEARSLASEPRDVAAILMELADAELARNRPVGAVEYWQEILSDARVRAAPTQSLTAGEVAEKALSDLIHDRGRAVYAEIEHRASEEIATLLAAKDVDRLRETLNNYPQAEATIEAWRQLAILERDAGKLNNAIAIEAQLMDRAILTEERIASQARWASTLEMAGYWRSAYVTWKQLLADSNAAIEIEFDGSRQQVSELARQRLSNPAYRTYDGARHVSLRQLERSWTNSSLENTGQSAVLLPQGEPPAVGLACVLVHSHQSGNSRWDCLDRATGQVRWSRSWTIAPQWCAYGESHLLIAIEGNLVAITLESGTELWSVPLSTSSGVNRSIMAETEGVRIPEERITKSPPVQIAVRNHFVMAYDPLVGVEVINSRTGKVCWTFAPPRGKLQRQWACGEEHIALQTLQPSTMWILDIAKERRVAEGRGSTEPWLQSPVISVDKEIIAMNTDRNIESRVMQAGRARWVYQGGMSFAHLDPVLWSAESHLLLTVDGMTLVSINRLTGRADWSVGISDRPLRHPSQQVIAKDEFAYAACQGLLRRISLETGKREWERFLGSATEQWRVAASDEAVAAWPIASSDSVDAKKQNSSFVVWCDGRDGRILHRLNFPRGEQAVEVTSDEQGWLVQTNQSLIAFRPVIPRVDVASAEKR